MLDTDRNISFCKVPWIDYTGKISETITDKIILLNSSIFEWNLEQLESILDEWNYELSHVKKSFVWDVNIFWLQLKNRFNYSWPDVLFSVKGNKVFFHSWWNKQELCIHKNSNICMHIHWNNHLWE